MNLLFCKLRERRFCQNEYRASLGGAMRAQGLAPSKMKGHSKSAKFKIWGTEQQRYVLWLVKTELLT